MEQDERRFEQRLVAKISWRLVPIIGLSYLIAYIDRANLSFASVSMNADLGFSQTVYGFGASAFFLSYALFEVPSNLLLQRFGARRWIARIMFTWGLVSIAMIFINAAWNFYLLRFLLGAAEAGFFPGVVHYLSGWLPARHRARAISRFYIAAPTGTVVMGGAAQFLLGLDGYYGLAGWQWLLLIEGLPALVMALVVWAALPESPDHASWLNAREKSWLTDRLTRDAAFTGDTHTTLRRSLSDPIVLMLGAALALLFLSTNAVTFSGPKLIIEAEGWTMAEASRTIALSGLVTIPTMLLTGIATDRMERPFRLMAALAVVGAAMAVAMAVGRDAGLVPIGYILFIAALQSGGMMSSILISRFVHPSGRPAGLAMNNTIAQSGAFFGPLLWGIAADRSGSFTVGLAMLVPLLLLAAVICLLGERVCQRGVAVA